MIRVELQRATNWLWQRARNRGSSKLGLQQQLGILILILDPSYRRAEHSQLYLQSQAVVQLMWVTTFSLLFLVDSLPTSL
jgi:hypothetical protein